MSTLQPSPSARMVATDAAPTPPPKIGRPRKFTNIDDFYAALNAYFAEQDAAEKPYTMWLVGAVLVVASVAGAALLLGAMAMRGLDDVS